MIKVAIIEDEKELREALSTILRRSEGLSCEYVFENAEEALKMIPEINPDVVLTDINLPGTSGIDCIKELKSKCPSIQFLMWTSFEDTESVFKALKAGATGYLTKTTQPSKLFDAILDIYNGGSPMSSQIARKIVSSFTESAVNTHLEKLTAREKEIIEFLSHGLRYKEIADRIFISTETVRTHIRNIYEKLQVNSRTEAINKLYAK